MTSSNVSNLLVQVSQVDVTVVSQKTTDNTNSGLFEKTMKSVANKASGVNSDLDSALPEKQTDKKVVSVDSSKTYNRVVKKEEKPTTKKTEVAE